jgi:hypothetical protein
MEKHLEPAVVRPQTAGWTALQTQAAAPARRNPTWRHTREPAQTGEELKMAKPLHATPSIAL